MSDTRHQVEVEFVGKDLTSRVIGNISKAASGLSKNVDAITSKVVGFGKTFGGLGAVFGFGASVHSAKQYLATIEELSTITGEGANSMAGLNHAMEQSGLRAEETRAIMISMARKQAEIAGGSKEMAKLAKRYGVELRKGPQAALVSMAKQVETGKIGTGEVVKLLEESGSKAMDLLRKGPAEVQRLLAEGSEKNAHINNTTVAQYKQMDIQMARVRQSWNRVTTTVMVKLAPVLTKLMRAVENRIDGWVEGAGKFGNFLAKHMDAAIASAKVFGKVMLANYAMMKLTGEGMLGNAGKLMKMAKGKNKFFTGGAKENILGMAMKGGKKNRGMVGLAAVLSKIPKIGPVLTKFFYGAVQLGNIAKFMLKLTLVGAVVGGIVKGIQMALKNIDGIRKKITDLLGGIWNDIKGIGEEIAKVFSSDSTLGQFLQWVGKGILGAFTKALQIVKAITGFARIVVRMITNLESYSSAKYGIAMEASAKIQAQQANTRRILDNLLKHQGAVTIKQVELLDEMKRSWMKQTDHLTDFDQEKEWKELVKNRGLGRFAQLPTSPQNRPQITQDFRGSRFEIQQNFAEGFDPDRIAVAFTDDLGKVGERRLQSGLAPAFAAR